MLLHKQSLLSQYQNEIWYWKQQPVKLKDLKDGQIKAILRILEESERFGRVDGKQPRNWFSKSTTYWKNAITMVTKSKNHNDLRELVAIVSNRRIEKAIRSANEIIDKITIKTEKKCLELERE